MIRVTLIVGLCVCLAAAALIKDKDPEEESANVTDNVHFLLYTRQNPDDPQELEPQASSVQNSNFNLAHKVAIVAHGFSSNGPSYSEMFRHAYHEMDEYNVIAIDWKKLAAAPNYAGAVINAKKVGEYAASFVATLLDIGVEKSQIHLVGHSLGAHLVGFMGKEVQDMGLGKLPRITGLDPAKPLYELSGPDGRIDKTDADFVDILHTNSGNLWDGCLSFSKALGHVDFYPNGGSHQPGCTDICVGGICDDNDINDLITGGCSHGRANEMFAESITAGGTHQAFVAWPCESWDEFQAGNCCTGDTIVSGEGTPAGSEGTFDYLTNEESPFARGDAGNYC